MTVAVTSDCTVKPRITNTPEKQPSMVLHTLCLDQMCLHMFVYNLNPWNIFCKADRLLVLLVPGLHKIQTLAWLSCKVVYHCRWTVTPYMTKLRCVPSAGKVTVWWEKEKPGGRATSSCNVEDILNLPKPSIGDHPESEMGELVSLLVIQYSWICDLHSVKVELLIFLIQSVLE